MTELEVAENACYASHHMIDKFLGMFSDCVEDDILRGIISSPAVCAISDKSTDECT